MKKEGCEECEEGRAVGSVKKGALWECEGEEMRSAQQSYRPYAVKGHHDLLRRFCGNSLTAMKVCELEAVVENDFGLPHARSAVSFEEIVTLLMACTLHSNSA